MDEDNFTAADFVDMVWKLDWETADLDVSVGQWLAAAMMATFCHEVVNDDEVANGAYPLICGLYMYDHEDVGDHLGAFASLHMINSVLGVEFVIPPGDPRLEAV